MLNSDLIHVIGSDSHRVSDSELVYSEGLQNIKEIVSAERYLELTRQNPQTILEGNYLKGDKNYLFNGPISKKERSRFWNLFKR